MSDHISGPRAIADPIADITDFYAYASPERPGHLVLIQNTLPFAQPSSHFSDGLIYRFRIRPVELDGTGNGIPFAIAAQEWTIDCVFSPVGDQGEQTGVCTASSGEVASFTVGDELANSTKGLRAFAGARWDPFFMDAPAALKTIATQQLAFTDPGHIFLDGKNVLSLVVELDVATLFGRHQVLAVITETLTRGKFSVRVERVGRPEVKT